MLFKRLKKKLCRFAEEYKAQNITVELFRLFVFRVKNYLGSFVLLMAVYSKNYKNIIKFDHIKKKILVLLNSSLGVTYLGYRGQCNTFQRQYRIYYANYVCLSVLTSWSNLAYFHLFKQDLNQVQSPLAPFLL